MIAIDSNVLLRLALRDDTAQFAVAERALATAARRGQQLFISDVVLCELVWVVRGSHKFRRTQIAAVLHELVDTDLFRLSDETVVRRAIDRFERGRGDFADYLIAEQSLAAGATEVLTFDRALKREPGFRLLVG